MFGKNYSLPAFYYKRMDNMRTTINADTILILKLREATAEVGLSKNELIKLLISRLIKKNSFVPKPSETVMYQDSGPERVWKIEHINLEPVFYEKVLDLRRHFKFSVSWFVAFGILNYLDDLLNDLSNSGNSEETLDNYVKDYVYISKMVGSMRVFITMMETQSKKT